MGPKRVRVRSGKPSRCRPARSWTAPFPPANNRKRSPALRRTACGRSNRLCWNRSNGDMKLSSRHLPVTHAEIEIKTAVTVTVEKYGLTYAEMFWILSSCIREWSKYAIRDERGTEEEATPP